MALSKRNDSSLDCAANSIIADLIPGTELSGKVAGSPSIFVTSYDSLIS